MPSDFITDGGELRILSCQILFGHPTGDSAGLSDKNGDLVLKGGSKDILERWYAHPPYGVGHTLLHEENGIPPKTDRYLMSLGKGSVASGVRRRRRASQHNTPLTTNGLIE